MKKNPFTEKRACELEVKGFFFTRTKSLLRRLKSVLSNTLSPFTINLEPKQGDVVVFLMFLKIVGSDRPLTKEVVRKLLP